MIRMDKIVMLCGLLLLAACTAHIPDDDMVQAQPSSNGVSLYETYCAGCHGTFARTTKPNRSAVRLRSAINHFPVMQDLDFLTDRQLGQVATALSMVNLQQASRID